MKLDRNLPAAEAYEAAGGRENAPRCPCHDEPQRWHKGKGWRCVVKNREFNRLYYDPDKERERKRLYREENRDKDLERQRRYREENPDKVRESDRRWREANLDKVREKKRRWHEANPDKVRERDRRRRARKAGARGHHTEAEWEARKDQWGQRCAYGVHWPEATLCQDDGATYEGDLTVGHVWPLAADKEGSSDDISNIVPLCPSCNSSQNNRPLSDWLASKGVNVEPGDPMPVLQLALSPWYDWTCGHSFGNRPKWVAIV